MNSTNRFAILSAALLCIISAHRSAADTFGSGANTFDIQFVSIGNPGNPADMEDGDSSLGGVQNFGSVAYEYRIGKFEISERMIDKANAEGGLGITKDTRGPDKPATNVSWNEATRFVNWLNTSAGSTPAYKFALQPGEAGYDANVNIQLWTPADAGYNPNNLYRNSLAKYFLPSVDEWYKAAYYSPSGVYFDYPTGSNMAPTPVASGTAAGTAVHNGQRFPADITLAGGLSPYGTMAQGGNVYEWQETDRDLLNDSSSSARGMHGGYWEYEYIYLHTAQRQGTLATNGDYSRGFRVASIPEPSTVLLGALASLGVLVWRRG